MILWLFACAAPGDLDPSDSNPFQEGVPEIASVDALCDVDEEEWVFEITTENWTGGGWVWLGKNANNTEGHRIKSISAAADGSQDFLRLKLDIEADWRDASRSQSTKYLCADQPVLNFMVTTYDARGEGVEDCRTWGPDPLLWYQVDAAYDCDSILEFEQDTGR
jgi:hypothetical protein